MTEDGFYLSPAWQALRARVFKRYGKKCQATGLTEADGVTLSIDHIRPRAKYPHLALKMSNMQVLELGLNKTKGTREWDFRPLKWRLYYKCLSILKSGVILTLFLVALAVALSGAGFQAVPVGQQSDFLSTLSAQRDVAYQEITRLRLEFCLSPMILDAPELAQYLYGFCELPESD